MSIQFEHTDIFGGEANYCWVHRAFTRNANLSDRYSSRWRRSLPMPCF